MPEDWLPAFAQAVEQRLGSVRSKDGLHRVKQEVARDMGVRRLPQDPELLPHVSTATQASHGHLLRKKPMRSQSGVAVLAVMSSPEACPHGKCVYCPGGPDVDAPQSYTGFEPSTMRAKRHGYDSYRIVRSRLAQLQRNGHETSKIEIIIQGGTFPARGPAYQDWFVAGIYAGCNDAATSHDGQDGHGAAEAPESGEGRLPLERWEAMSTTERDARLTALQRANEGAACRVVGLTVETKPDWCFEPHVDAMLRHGATRIELGVQTLDDEVTALTNRGHTVDDARRAMQVARDAGFKVCCHLMPGLPRPVKAPGGHGPQKMRFAVDEAADVEDVRRFFSEEAWRPDMLKVYPTLVVEEGETTLKRWWREGRFEPMDTAGATRVVAAALEHVPEYCRIQRIDRDIPTTHVLAGVKNSNLRQLAEAEARRRGIRIREIRAREVGTRLREGREVRPERVVLVRRDHRASGGQEVFLSLEDPVADAVVGFLRLRRVARSHRPEFQHPNGVAVVRELKVYGVVQGVGHRPDVPPVGPAEGPWSEGDGPDGPDSPEPGSGDPDGDRDDHGHDGENLGHSGDGHRHSGGGHGDTGDGHRASPALDGGAIGVWQHQGHGARLLAEAETIARDGGVGRLLVIAGPGVKPYYRHHGYHDLGPYVAKEFP